MDNTPTESAELSTKRARQLLVERFRLREDLLRTDDELARKVARQFNLEARILTSILTGDVAEVLPGFHQREPSRQPFLIDAKSRGNREGGGLVCLEDSMVLRPPHLRFEVRVKNRQASRRLMVSNGFRHLYQLVSDLSPDKADDEIASRGEVFDVKRDWVTSDGGGLWKPLFGELAPLVNWDIHSHCFDLGLPRDNATAVVRRDEGERKAYVVIRGIMNAGYKLASVHCSEPELIPLYRPNLLLLYENKVDRVKNAPNVFLTDSLESAKMMGMVNVNETVEVIGFYGDVDRVDWTPLHGRRIFYVLFEHSGMGGEEVVDRAKMVAEALGTHVSAFECLSFLPSGFLSRKPSFPRAPQRVTREGLVELGPTSLLRADECEDYRSPRLLFTPIVREASLTLIVGQEEIGTCLALSVAFCCASGPKTRMCPGGYWFAEEPVAGVVYFHGESKMYPNMPFAEKSRCVARYLRLASVPSNFVDVLYGSPSSPFKVLQEVFRYIEQLFGAPSRGRASQPVLVVLDGVLDLKAVPKKELSPLIADMRAELARRNIAMILVNTPVSGTKHPLRCATELRFDRLVRLDLVSPRAGHDLGIDITAASPPFAPDPCLAAYLELDRNLKSPGWRYVCVPDGAALKREWVTRWTQQGFTSTQMADLFKQQGVHMSPAAIRQGKKRWGLAKPRKQKRQREPSVIASFPRVERR